MSGSEDVTYTVGKSYVGKAVKAQFAGLGCLAIEFSDIGIAVKMPGTFLGWASSPEARRAIKFGRNISSDQFAQKGQLECSTCRRMRVDFLADGRVLTFPYVLNAPPHHFVVDQVVLKNNLGDFDSESGVQIREGDGWTLTYRVTCPGCRDRAETVASNVFAEMIERSGGWV